MKRAILFGCFYGILLIIAYLNREFLLTWLNESDATHLPLMITLSVLFGVIPIVPFTVFAGLMGAKYGVWLGSLINWIGSMSAATIFFVFSRYFFMNNFQNYISQYEQIQKFNQIISRNAFIAILFCRLIPIIPPPVVNIYSGISSMLFREYFIATAIGQIPGMMVYAYLGNQLFTSVANFIKGIMVYVIFILLILPIYHKWYKSK